MCNQTGTCMISSPLAHCPHLKTAEFHWFLVLLLRKGGTVPLSPLWFLAWTEAGFPARPQRAGAQDTEWERCCSSLIPWLCLLSWPAVPFPEPAQKQELRSGTLKAARAAQIPLTSDGDQSPITCFNQLEAFLCWHANTFFALNHDSGWSTSLWMW